MQQTAEALNPIRAVTHPDPYPYYADLVAHRPVFYDDTIGCWVVSSAEAVRAVLRSAGRVRPAQELVPRHLAGSPAADIFGKLVRMNDGDKHLPLKGVISRTLASVAVMPTAEESRKWAQVLLDDLNPLDQPGSLTDYTFQLSIYVLASLLGIPNSDLRQTAVWIGDYLASLSPVSSAEQIAQGNAASARLLEQFHGLLAEQSGTYDALLPRLAREAEVVGHGEKNAIVANAIGFLTQAYEATAGLIGNTLVTLATHEDIYEQIQRQPDLPAQVVHEVVRYDAPVQNTRRFLDRDAVIAGQPMREGDTVIVLLAAANRDPSANPQPDRFDPHRSKRQSFTFGVGVHACPGETLATTIAAAGVEKLLAAGLSLDGLAENMTYRPSLNTRIPLFNAKG